MALVKAPKEKNKAFQKACQIAIKKDVPYGYVLKSDYGIADEKGPMSMVHLPRTNAMAYDLSDTPFAPKIFSWDKTKCKKKWKIYNAYHKA